MQPTQDNIQEVNLRAKEAGLHVEKIVPSLTRRWESLIRDSVQIATQMGLDTPNCMEQIRKSNEDFAWAVIDAVVTAPLARGSVGENASEQIVSAFSYSPSKAFNKTGELANLMIENAYTQNKTVWDFWRPAQKHVMDLMEATIITARSVDEASKSLTYVMCNFPTWLYLTNMQSLAQYMWEQSGYPVNVNPLDYWVSAEKHLLAIAKVAIRAAGSALEAGTALVQALETFSPEKRFEDIQRMAFIVYKEKGEKHGGDVEDWLKAEKKLCEDDTPK